MFLTVCDAYAPSRVSLERGSALKSSATYLDQLSPIKDPEITEEEAVVSPVEPAELETFEKFEKFVPEGFVDEEALFAASDFPMKPQDLMARAVEVLSPSISLGTKDDGECLAEDFEFCAAVVGPIGKEEYLGALGSFKIEDGFDQDTNFYGMSVDPMQTNRVWMFNRVRAIHTGTFMGAEASGKEIEYPPQVFHLDFNADGKIKEVGFYTADRRQGNTGGLGGAFGYMYAVGKPLPIPECQPFKRSKRFRALSLVGKISKKLNNFFNKN